MGPGEFLSELWGQRPPGFVHLWDLRTKRTVWLPASDSADMAMGAEGAAGRADVYCSVALAHRRGGMRQRLHAEQAVAIAGLWLDVDVVGPTHKTGLASMDAALDLVAEHFAPTLIVDSGFGLHAWWLLDGGPWRFASRDEQAEAASLARRIHALHRLGETSDLSRVLRLPGTINAKVDDDLRPVRVVGKGGPRYPLAVLRDRLAAVPDQPVTSAGQLELPSIQAGGLIEPQILAALLVNSEEIADAWHHRRRLGDGSLSAYDMSLASLAANAGLADDQIAGLIAAHRLHHDPTDIKHLRSSYLARTIATARATSKRDQHLDRIGAALDPTRRAA